MTENMPNIILEPPKENHFSYAELLSMRVKRNPEYQIMLGTENRPNYVWNKN